MTKPTPVNARIAGLRDLEPSARLDAVCAAAGLDQSDRALLTGEGVLPLATANGMIENVVGKFEMPMGVATNFCVNGKDYLIPMVVEEPSVVAAASYMARIARAGGGFHASADDPVMRAQVQVLGVSDPAAARLRILEHRGALMALANSKDKVLTGLGGGCKDIEVHVFDDTPVGPMVVLHLIVDVRDAMGANTVNTMAELLAAKVEAITGGSVRLRILSNLADLRLVRARVELEAAALDTDTLKGTDVAQGIVEACALAVIDPYRAATHNKGIMNGIDPVVIATGNDWRAVEAGAHAFAASSGRYTALTRWERTTGGGLSGSIELPMALGLVGGATRTHPAAQAALRLLRVETATELAQVVAAVGLAQNMAALRALATEGIQRGHMALHARNIAITAGATGADIDRVARAIVAAGDITVDHARSILDET
ncbi:hydroxymethylglutaryl-CoA reductase, degradative [Sulfitobacter pseudonitzschiae]|uniref:3-hydroxy-3-methylglutaryl coenzyme A reductase n=1 Tax=Pseudosulfitobacter pseudonitzschiae TaxID=1402135 RepID=A0A9Q2NLR6_9RHOB|nr:hydroxymethylglutaryl-CoA reductase, degradative [Pseudosulfitobacter pseudonitzschiae]MBM2290802.1 hydroxymethylglutaryl-CoA reductase, degradative [Pseudosulfitobacter pseudonitzschiae]MBM2295720.1 hydroxymethylglutaryl-CoA reductase, degradative [Pseudosulfitobacter pseudonitzschiae]MBM2300632.1 hydroxymethylglutaryl-CoA reductase, degradative [Pseudosulfitobacter pseudonitzschiae]MBM2310417.1 hydroxymethylglutaryl-CoA reductase, degradative [Pseudosulfitobacter pseudonitzschiae]MBM23153